MLLGRNKFRFQSLFQLSKGYSVESKDFHNEYQNQNKEAIANRKREYNLKNQDVIREKKRIYNLNNKTTIREKKKVYNLKMKDQVRENYIDKKSQVNPNYVPTSRKFPLKSWKTPKSTRDYFEAISQSLHISDPSDWYRISRTQIQSTGGVSIFSIFGSLGVALQFAYPEYNWDLSKFAYRGKKSTQRWLCVTLKELLPHCTIVEDYLHPDLEWDKKMNIQIDVWVKEHNLALEYQGEHHYLDLYNAYGPTGTTALFYARDEEKKKLCAEKGIKLVCIPYWWDGSVDSLSSTLHETLPNVFPKTDSPPIRETQQ